MPLYSENTLDFCLGVYLYDYVTNALILICTGQPHLTTTIRKLRLRAFLFIYAVFNPAPKPSTFWPPPHLHHGAAHEDDHHSAGLTKSWKILRCPWVMPWQQPMIEHRGDHSFVMLRVLRRKQPKQELRWPTSAITVLVLAFDVTEPLRLSLLFTGRRLSRRLL